MKPKMMTDEEIVKTVAYMKKVVREKYRNFSHVDDIVDEVTVAVIETARGCDTNHVGYRGYMYRGTMMKVNNYWLKYFWDRSRKADKPALTVEHISYGRSFIDNMPDPKQNPDNTFLRVKIQTELARFPERERDIFSMVFIDEESMSDVARKYGLSTQRVSQICITVRQLLSKRLSAYRGGFGSHDKCRQCGGGCREGLPLCDTCRAENRRVSLSKTATKKRRERGMLVRKLAVRA